jgi:steroid 5-alpha reductase family enzyme
MFFNLVNGFINGYWLGTMAPGYDIRWITDPRFLIGVVVFLTGFIINQVSDHKLIRLRAGGKTGYFIPRGGLFQLISCPNFFGEILEWTGFAIMTWSLPGLSFAIWTAANLIPRALHHHAWYRSTFPDYPQHRKALIPFLL